jgi:hypothetical protein
VQETTDGRVSFIQEGRPVTIKLRSSQGDEIELPGLARAPSMISPDDPDFRIRVKAGHIDFVVSPSVIGARQSTGLTINFHLNEKRPFIDQVGLLALSNWSSLGSVSASVEIEQGQLFGATINIDAPLPKWAEESWVCAQYFLEILGIERCKRATISLLDFHRFTQDYLVLATLLNSRSIRFEGEFDSQIAEFSKLVGYSYGQFGDWTFGAIHQFEVSSKLQEDEKLMIDLAKPRVVQKSAFMKPLAQSVEDITLSFKEFLTRQEVPVATLDDGNLFEWGKSYTGNGTIVIQVHDVVEPSSPVQ